MAEVEIKPLEWENFFGADLRGGAAAAATCIFGRYHAYGDGAWSSPDRFATPATKGTFADAKAAAQADYEARIRSALVPATPMLAQRAEIFFTADYHGAVVEYPDRSEAMRAAEQIGRTAAERIRDAEAQIEALTAKLDALAPHTCGCSYDTPDDLCMHHSPKLAAAEARAEKAERERDEALLATRRIAVDSSDAAKVARVILAKGHAEAREARLREALDWYEAQVRDCRKISLDGNTARKALDADGGNRARTALSETSP